VTELEQIKMENERLSSHHSNCKKELADLVYLAQKWRIRSFVAEKLLRGLNKVAKWWYPDDLKKEIKIHTEWMLAAWKRREVWHRSPRTSRKRSQK
jgi:hypothetical protein